MNTTNKNLRRFSSAFKKEKVDLLDQGKISVKELSKIYDVSPTSIYKWKTKYSKYEKTERIVIEKISEETKNIELLKRIAELEHIVGKKQLELDYYKTTIEVMSEEEGEDLVKKHKPKS
jgi:transposase-like protein